MYQKEIFFIKISPIDATMSRQYELPEEQWSQVMSYFHSSYKKPLHYEAIITCKDFVRRRDITKCFGHSPLGNIDTHSVYDSFYIWIVSANWIYWNVDVSDTRKPTVKLVRKVAKGQVKKEFKEIYKTYADHSSARNLLSKIYY